jgi:phenylacetate-coenzyme A ligase PaaK-like adenylate-forming protein
VSVVTESDALHARVRAEIARGGPRSPDELAELALAIARFQREHVAVVRRLFEARGVDADHLDSVDRIPAVPTDTFRLRRVAAHPASLDVRVFRTSGTTAGRRGEHPFRTLETYARGALAHGAEMLWPDGRPDRVIVLAPSATALPDSSLSYMIDLFAETIGAPTTHHLGPSGIDWASLEEAVRHARSAKERVLLFGTAFAFVWLLDGLAERGLDLSLPEGARAMLTGGFKGRAREVPEPELRAALTSALGLAETHVIGEYGMTELSSQLYEPRLTGGDLYVAPPWVRVVATDPESLEPVGDGREGLCRVIDLANVDSAVAIQTNDLVRVEPSGVRLLGRAPGATPRGCSLAIEEIMEGTDGRS